MIVTEINSDIYLFSTLDGCLVSDSKEMSIESFARETVFSHYIVDLDCFSQKPVDFTAIFYIVKVGVDVELGEFDCFMSARTNSFSSPVLEGAS